MITKNYMISNFGFNFHFISRKFSKNKSLFYKNRNKIEKIVRFVIDGFKTATICGFQKTKIFFEVNYYLANNPTNNFKFTLRVYF